MKTNDGKSAVEQANRQEPKTKKIDWVVDPYFVGDERCHKRIIDVLVGLEHVLKYAVEVVEGVPLGIYVDWLLHDGVESAHLVKAKGVVNMVVRK